MTSLDPQRGKMLKELITFQVKLGLDALFDLLLSPVALAAGIADIARGHAREQSLLREVKKLAHEWESWLNIYGAHTGGKRRSSADRLFRQVEVRARRKMREQHDATRPKSPPQADTAEEQDTTTR